MVNGPAVVSPPTSSAMGGCKLQKPLEKPSASCVQRMRGVNAKVAHAIAIAARSLKLTARSDGRWNAARCLPEVPAGHQGVTAATVALARQRSNAVANPPRSRPLLSAVHRVRRARQVGRTQNSGRSSQNAQRLRTPAQPLPEVPGGVPYSSKQLAAWSNTAFTNLCRRLRRTVLVAAPPRPGRRDRTDGIQFMDTSHRTMFHRIEFERRYLRRSPDARPTRRSAIAVINSKIFATDALGLRSSENADACPARIAD